MLCFVLQREAEMSVSFYINYDDEELNALLGIAKASSYQKTHTFVHDKMRFLMLYIADELKKNAPTPAEIHSKASELTKGFSNDYSILITHEKAYSMAYKTWIGNKKLRNKDVPQPTPVSPSRNFIAQTSLLGMTEAQPTKLFRVRQLKRGISLSLNKSKKLKSDTQYVEVSFQALRDFYETRYRKASSTNLSRIFYMTARKLRGTRRVSGTIYGSARSGSNEADWMIGDVWARVIVKSPAFGKKHFTEAVKRINPWLRNPKAEGRQLYPGSRNEKAVNAGIERTKTDILEHLRNRGLLFNEN